MRLTGIVLVSSILLLASPAIARELTVTFDAASETVSLKAIDADRRSIMQRFADESGWRVELPTAAKEQAITLTLDRFPVAQFLDRVLGRCGNWLISRSSQHNDNSPSRVMLLGCKTNRTAHQFEDRSPRSIEIVPGQDSMASRVMTLRGITAETANYQTLKTLYEYETDPRVRQELVLTLSRIGGDSSYSIIEKALLDSNAKVRMLAVNAAARIGGKKAKRDISRVASTDEEASVKNLASARLESLVEAPTQ